MNLTKRLHRDGDDSWYLAYVESIQSVPITAATKYKTIITAPLNDREATRLGSSQNPMYQNIGVSVDPKNTLSRDV